MYASQMTCATCETEISPNSTYFELLKMWFFLIVFNLLLDHAIAFIWIATSDDAEKSFKCMKETTKRLIQKRGCKNTKYIIIQPSQDSTNPAVTFGEFHAGTKELLARVDELERLESDQKLFHLQHELSAALRYFESLESSACKKVRNEFIVVAHC